MAAPRIPRPSFHAANIVGNTLEWVGWLVLVAGVVVSFLSAQVPDAFGTEFSLVIFLTSLISSVTAGLLLLAVGHAVQIVSYLGERMAEPVKPAKQPLAGDSSPVRPWMEQDDA